jgi:hypothetical protein
MLLDKAMLKGPLGSSSWQAHEKYIIDNRWIGMRPL